MRRLAIPATASAKLSRKRKERRVVAAGSSTKVARSPSRRTSRRLTTRLAGPLVPTRATSPSSPLRRRSAASQLTMSSGRWTSFPAATGRPYICQPRTGVEPISRFRTVRELDSARLPWPGGLSAASARTSFSAGSRASRQGISFTVPRGNLRCPVARRSPCPERCRPARAGRHVRDDVERSARRRWIAR